MRSSVLLAIAIAILPALLAVPAHAQATRTWISGVGDDANPCSRTAPCKTFAGAIAKTTAQGEINCLDPGGFGGLTITKSISILCDGVSNGGVLVSGTNGFIINGAAIKVYLSGLDFEGLGPGSTAGLNGIQITAASAVYIIHCTIRDFATNGVFVNSSTNPTRVIIKDSIIENNGVGGTTAGGINVQGSGGATNGVDVITTLVDGNANFAAQATGSNSVVAFTRSYLTGSPIGLNLVSGAGGTLIGPSNVITGSINGTTTSVSFK